MPRYIPGLLLACLCFVGNIATAAPPNIIVVLTDDQGYGDLSCHGNPILKTPHLDKMHAESVRFTDFHVSPTCAPTRSALMTGRHEFKNGVTHTIFERERLTLKATTLAQVLQSAGYQTGIFGKWHLGDEDPYQPDKRGFDEVFIHGAGGIGQTYPGSCGDAPKNSYFGPVIKHNGKFVKTDGYCTDEFFQHAIAWMDKARADKKPFFTWIATNAPHGPLNITPEYEAIYKDQVPPNVAKFFGMIANIDDNIGKLQAFLAEKQLDDNTLVIFMNDNGGTAGVPTFNAGMRGSKVTPWEGGTRGASFWRWKNTLTPGNVAALTAHIDVFPTLAEIVGAKLSDSVQKQVEGRSLMPLLKNPQAYWGERFLFTQTGRWDPKTDGRQAKRENAAVRWRSYTLVATPKETQGEWQLFDLSTDPGQKLNIAESKPEIVKKLAAAYDEWWESLPPYLINEQQTGPKWNPFHEQYWRQYRGPGPNNAPVPDGFALP
ncbi:MAG: arylsulfatase [Planctomycetaceae bacterium]|nr:arylsulfatase [Planctomycetaceae bacterium]